MNKIDAKIIFIRHAESEFNLAEKKYKKGEIHVMPCIVDADITNKGKKQAEHASVEIYKLIKNHKEVAHCIISPMKRTRRTFSYIKKVFDDKKVSYDCEINSLYREFKTDSCDFLKGEVQVKESLDDLNIRTNNIISHLKSLEKTNKLILIVSHGDLLHDLIKKISNCDVYLLNCGVYVYQ